MACHYQSFVKLTFYELEEDSRLASGVRFAGEKVNKSVCYKIG